MKREEFVKTFLEGAAFAPEGVLVHHLVGLVFDLRQQVYSKTAHIEYMDEVARDCGWSMKCRSCSKEYEPDCELSEMSHEGNYCGGSEYCCP